MHFVTVSVRVGGVKREALEDRLTIFVVGCSNAAASVGHLVCVAC